MELSRSSLIHDLSLIQTQSPVVFCLTNLVAMDLNANALLALGASPIMSAAPEETADLIAISRALVVNLGTLTTAQIAHMEKALDFADGKIPAVLDPVGAGATSLRTETARRFAAHPALTAIRGNASELTALRGHTGTTRGVDSTLDSAAQADMIQDWSRDHRAVLVMSGAVDFVAYRGDRVAIAHGHPMMVRVTAMGCTATAIVAGFLAVNADPFRAATHAMATMGLCGEYAARDGVGPGTFRVRFLDALANAHDVVAL